MFRHSQYLRVEDIISLTHWQKFQPSSLPGSLRNDELKF